MSLPTKAKLTPAQNTMMEIARVGFMNQCPFFCYYFYDQMIEYPTTQVPTAATDGRRLFYNPEYLATLKDPERVFVLAHEVHHAIDRHPARFLHYRREGGLRNLPFSQELANIAADYVINADLVETDVGMINPAWLYDPNIKGSELTEDVYEKLYKKLPPPPPQGGGGQQGQSGSGHKPSTHGASSGRKGGKEDAKAQASGGRFDEVMDPATDPATGKEDLPDDSQFRESVARAAAAAKAMGKMPANFQRMVDEILEPQISWREHIRMLVTGKIGSRHETWEKPNRRRLVLNPIVILPGRRGYGAKDVVVALDTSGSIYSDEKALAVFFGEVGGILADVRPRRVILIHCDAQVQRVDEAATLDELAHFRSQGVSGGGGTSFIPPFEYLAEHDIRPDAMIYLTDLMGSFPEHAPAFPVIWAATTDIEVPWGDVVRIKT